jgi:hypothetical protein
MSQLSIQEVIENLEPWTGWVVDEKRNQIFSERWFQEKLQVRILFMMPIVENDEVQVELSFWNYLRPLLKELDGQKFERNKPTLEGQQKECQEIADRILKNFVFS